MQISFVIPAYNEEDYIGRCLESIVREIKSSPDIAAEIIVVNNVSTDQTREAALKYPGVAVVDEQKRGTASARQKGFLTAKGELVAFIDADVILPRGWLKKVMAEFEKDKSLVCLSGPHIFYDFSKINRFLTKIFYVLGFVVYSVNKHVLKIGSAVQGSNAVIRRAALEKIGGFDTSISFYGDDTDIARRLHKVGNVKFTFSLPAYASARRLRQEGIVTSGFRYSINYFWTMFLKKPFNKKAEHFRPKPEVFKEPQ